VANQRLTRLLTVVAGAVVISLSGPTALAQASAPALLVSPYQLGAIQQQVVLSDPQDFVGVVTDPQHGIATLYTAAGRTDSPSFHAAMSKVQSIGKTPTPRAWQKLQKVSLTIATAPRSLSVLQSIMSQVPIVTPWSTLTRPYLVDWYPDASSDTVHVGLTKITPAITDAARQTFGSAVQLQPAKPMHAVADRHMDLPPYFGGDTVLNGNPVTGGTECTAGFAATDDSTGDQGMLTAGHCFPVGNLVYQGYYDPSSGYYYPGTAMGLVSWQVYGGGQTDAEFIDAAHFSSVSPSVYTSLTAASPVVGLQPNYANESFCADGGLTMENCTGKLQSTLTCVNASGVNTCDQDCGQSTNNSQLAQPGDSGGPVYEYGNGGLLAMGLISSVDQTGTYMCYSDLPYVLTNNHSSLLTS
jgi:hypothetical protein